MRQARKRFRPSVWATLATLVAVGVCAWAGLWQLDRGEQKKTMFSEFEGAATSQPLGSLVPESLAPAYRFRRFIVRGRYDSEHQILLDSMLQDGRVGYQVLTPLLMGTSVILVNRGWVAADPDRAVLPEVAVNEQARYVRGRLNSLPRPGIIMPPRDVRDGVEWPRRLLFPTAQDIEQQLGIALYDYQLLLDEADADGFERRWRPDVMGPERHIGYAVQWFSFGIVACIAYFIMNRKKVYSDE